MNRYLAVVYGTLSYTLFLAVFLYLMGFVGGLVPRSVDNAGTAPVGLAVLIDVALVTLFAVQHSVMARPGFKKWWTRIVPTPIERSTYVLVASLVLVVLYWQWREIPAVLWDVSWQPARLIVWTLFWLGWAIVLGSTFMINHFELFGLKQVFEAWRARPSVDTGFRVTLFYRVVRHPLMLGFLIAFWAAPTMTAGHLVFAAAMTGYILIALQLEEHDLIAALGARYAEYRQRVPMLIPGLRKRGTDIMVP
ncbi:methanethiol S-methyltransferase [Mycobacterium sp. 2YAF39]|uniref:methanethiol S-methyltransferase n=1 Tax=Mycobacterium sp. 2YAF39 TaxID=3233033 RepID=UPI003F9AF8BA